jgi:hypothetical protein
VQARAFVNLMKGKNMQQEPDFVYEEILNTEKQALKVQEGGNHYKEMKIQPVEYIHANHIGFIEGNIIKYISRWRDKNGKQDLLKARHFIDLLIDLEGL